MLNDPGMPALTLPVQDYVAAHLLAVAEERGGHECVLPGGRKFYGNGTGDSLRFPRVRAEEWREGGGKQDRPDGGRAPLLRPSADRLRVCARTSSRTCCRST